MACKVTIRVFMDVSFRSASIFEQDKVIYEHESHLFQSHALSSLRDVLLYLSRKYLLTHGTLPILSLRSDMPHPDRIPYIIHHHIRLHPPSSQHHDVLASVSSRVMPGHGRVGSFPLNDCVMGINRYTASIPLNTAITEQPGGLLTR